MPLRFVSRSKRGHALAALVAATVIAALLAVYWPKGEQEVYVALFGRVRDTPFEAIHRHALEHYLASLSDETPGYRFTLKPRYLDDEPGRLDDPATLQRFYRTIVADDERYVVAIDNT
jgi:hypothetical protein